MRSVPKVLISVLLTVSLAGCAQIGQNETSKSVNAVLSEQIAGTTDSSISATNTVSTETSLTTSAIQSETTADAANQTIDYDLTTMNGDMVYATVYQMMTDPEPYFGKTVKMSGEFATATDGTTTYFACLVFDALECCSQGIEFIWGDGNHVYPDEYPSVGSMITVQGIFEAYEDNGYTYCRLRNASLQSE